MSHVPAGRPGQSPPAGQPPPAGFLPPAGLPFVGRRTELAQLATMLARARLVTVTGPGGVGKTRLAMRAAQNPPANLDSACVVSLSPVTDPRLVAHAVAARLGLAEQDPAPARDAVVRYLRDRKLLLVLDTCEHLLDACADLAGSLLQGTDGVTILATSRQPLDVGGENLFPLPPLPVPAEGEPPSPGDAAVLFARAAARTVPGFELTGDNTGDVVRVCRRLDGIPLAIELAAARLDTMSVADLARRPSPLTPGALDRAMGWSYDLCTGAEQALWQRLSVFAGAISVEAAEDVCSGPDLPRDAVLETLVGLVDKSVLAREPDEEPDGGAARFRQLDTIREFGARKLAAGDAGPGVRRRFIDRYLKAARYFRDHFLDDDQAERMAELRREHPNLQAALACCLGGSSDDLDRTGAELATALFGYWQAAGLQREGTHWMDRVLDRFGEPGPERARALGVRCFLGTTSGHACQAVADGRESVRLAAEAGDEQAGARGFLYLCHALAVAEDYAAALEAGAEAQKRLTALGDDIGLRILAAHMAWAHQLAGDLDQAEAWYKRGIGYWGQTRERWSTGWLHLVGGYTYFQRGRLDECAAVWRLALRSKHDIGDVVGTGYALDAFAMLAMVQKRYRRAAWLFGASDPMWKLAGTVLSDSKALTELRAGACAHVRTTLGPRTFDTLRRRGERCPLPQAVEAAIADADTLPSPPGETSALSPREEQVAELAVTGLSNREIAGRMSISKRTVDAHIEHIYAKLGVSSRVGLARRLQQRGSPGPGPEPDPDQ